MEERLLRLFREFPLSTITTETSLLHPRKHDGRMPFRILRTTFYVKHRYHDRRRSFSEDSYDHLRRRREDQGDFYGRYRSPSLDRDSLYDHVRRRSRDRSPGDFYNWTRRHSLEGPPPEYYIRGRRYSDDYGGAGRFRRHSADYGRRRRYSDEVLLRPRRAYSFDSLAGYNGRMRRYHSDPYIDQMAYRQVVPVRSVSRPAYTVLQQPAYTRVAPTVQPAYTRVVAPPVEPAYTRVVAPPIQSAYSGVNYVRRPIPIEYIDNPVPEVQYIQQPRVAPPRVQYIERPIPQPVQYIERPVIKPVRYVTKRPVVKPVEYVERPVIVERPVVTRAVNRYQIDGDLTPVETGPRTVEIKYDNVRTNFEGVVPRNDVRVGILPRNDVREVSDYVTQPIVTGRAYTAYNLGKSGRRSEDIYGGYEYDYRKTYGGNSQKELDHVLYHGNGKMTEVFEEADYNNNKARILR